MTSGLLLAELTASCSALGYYDGSKYFCEPHCAETTKDLIGYLRRDDDNHTIRLFLGNTKLLQTDLLPIIRCHANNTLLFNIVIRLVTNLTTPALLVFKENLPKNSLARKCYLEIVRHLQSYKESFADPSPWTVIADKLSQLLNTSDEIRDDDTDRSIERILILVRNVLHVPSSEDFERRPDNDASIHDQVLWALHQSSMLDIILYMASSQQENAFYMHIMEIICLLIREQNPQCLAKSAAQRSTQEKSQDIKELEAFRQQEMVSKMEKMRKYRSTRNFGGTYVIKSLKSTTDKDLIYHKPFTNMENVSLDLEKKKVKLPKNRQPLKWESVERRSALSIRLILKQFCIEILNAAYNPLMRYVKGILVRQASQDNDESYYFTAMKFFMEFNRYYNFQVKLVCETLSVETFHFVQKYIETYREMMITDKGKIPLWSPRMHITLNVYKELLYNLIRMDSSSDEGVRDSSQVLKSNIFYAVEYRELILELMKSYKKNQHSLQYLRDLIETAHVFLKLIEKFGKNKKIFVQHVGRKNVKKKKSNTSKSKKSNVKSMSLHELSPEEHWSQISQELERVMSSSVTADVIPFDAASDIPMEDQKLNALKRIQAYMKVDKIPEAVALIRAAREVWTENNSFGTANMTLEEEMDAFKDIFFVDLGENIMDIIAEEENDDEPEEDIVEEEETNYLPAIQERSFNVTDFLKSFANPKVLYICGMLLQNYNNNSLLINHCIAKMMHRIAFDCSMPAMLFQASVFRSWQRIFAEENSKYKELATLGIYVMRKFTEIAATNKKLLVELLFWKSSSQAYDIEMGYGSYQESKKSHSLKNIWEEHEEEELRRLYSEFKGENIDPKNMVSWVTSNLIKERSEKAVMKKLVELELIQKKSKRGVWSEKEEAELRQLFDEFKSNPDPLTMLHKALVSRSKKNIKDTLLRLGIVNDPQELRKKRTSIKNSGENTSLRKHNKKIQNTSEASYSGSDDSSDSEAEYDLAADRLKQREATERPKIHVSVKAVLDAASFSNYLVEGLEWLKESMNDAIEDCEDGSNEEVPLLPLTEPSVKSISDSVFTCLLKSLGLHPPLKLQEQYWRFPGDWKKENYLNSITLIQAMVEAINSSEEEIKDKINNIIKDSFGEDISNQMSGDNEQSSDDESDNQCVDKFSSMVADELKPSKKTSRFHDSSDSSENESDFCYPREQSPAYSEFSVQKDVNKEQSGCKPSVSSPGGKSDTYSQKSSSSYSSSRTSKRSSNLSPSAKSDVHSPKSVPSSTRRHRLSQFSLAADKTQLTNQSGEPYHQNKESVRRKVKPSVDSSDHSDTDSSDKFSNHTSSTDQTSTNLLSTDTLSLERSQSGLDFRESTDIKQCCKRIRSSSESSSESLMNSSQTSFVNRKKRIAVISDDED